MTLERRLAEVLLVEDDPAHALIIRRHFERIGAQAHLTHVEDGAAALDHLYGRTLEGAQVPRADLVLLDLRLPKVDGLEVLRQVKSDPSLRRTPVIALTTSAAERDVSRAYDLSVNSYLVKPVDFDQFSQVLDTVAAYWLATNLYPP